MADLYDRLKELSLGNSMTAHGFTVCRVRGGWYDFTRAGYIDTHSTGWKFHISVDALDMRRAMEIVVDVSQKFGVDIFKAADHKFAVAQSMGHPQAGKSFVLFDTGKQDWRRILQEIEDRFENADPPIEPIRNKAGARHPVFPDKPVKGSNYSYYRHQGKDDSYISADEIRERGLPEDLRHNPLRLNDPFLDLKIGNPRFNRPEMPRDFSATLAQCFRLRKHSAAVFSTKVNHIADIDGLETKLNKMNVGNRRVWGTVDPGRLYFEIDCPDEKTARLVMPYLNRHLRDGIRMDAWTRIENVTALGAFAPKEDSLESYELVRAFEAEGITPRLFYSNNLERMIFEVSRAGKADPKARDDAGKIERMIERHKKPFHSPAPARTKPRGIAVKSPAYPVPTP